MRVLFVAFVLPFMTLSMTAQGVPFAKDGMVRAAYLATNPAHAVKDPKTGEARGVVIDLVQELGRLHKVKATAIPLPNPAAVIEAVRKGEAEIGFVAYNPERAGPVEFSKPYLLVNQTFIVRDDSPIKAIADIDKQGRKLGATRADSIALYLGRTLKQGQLVQLDNSTPDAVVQMLREGTMVAFGASRHRRAEVSRGVAGGRGVAVAVFGVEQTIIVPGGRRDAQDAANAFIDDVRKSGFLQKSIDRSGVIGISVAQER